MGTDVWLLLLLCASAAPPQKEAPPVSVADASVSSVSEKAKEQARALENQVALQSQQQEVENELVDARAQLKMSQAAQQQSEQSRVTLLAQNKALADALAADQAHALEQQQVIAHDVATINALKKQAQLAQADHQQYVAVLSQLNGLVQRTQALSSIADQALTKATSAEALVVASGAHLAQAAEGVMAVERHVDSNRQMLTTVSAESAQRLRDLQRAQAMLANVTKRVDGLDQTVAMVGSSGGEMAKDVAKMEEMITPLAQRADKIASRVDATDKKLRVIQGQVDTGIHTAIAINVGQMMQELRAQIRSSQQALVKGK